MTGEDVKALVFFLEEMLETDRSQQVQLDLVLGCMRMINKQCKGLNKRLEVVEHDLTQLSHATTLLGDVA